MPYEMDKRGVKREKARFDVPRIASDPWVIAPPEGFGKTKHMSSEKAARPTVIHGNCQCLGGLGLVALFLVTTILFLVHPGIAGAVDVGWPISGTATPDLPINGPFGPRLLSGTTYDFHRGIDIRRDQGTPVYAVADGTVHFADHGSAFGGSGPYADNSVVLRHTIDGSTVYSFYTHLHTFTDLADGTAVTQGMEIGTVGVGTSTYAHLHFELREGANYQKNAVNPFRYLPYADTGAPPLTVDQVDMSNPLNPIVSLSVSLPALEPDLVKVGVQVHNADTGALIDSHAYDMPAWNLAYTTAELDDPTFNGVNVNAPHFLDTSPTYDITFLFHALTGSDTASALDFRFEATDALGNSTTASSIIPTCHQCTGDSVMLSDCRFVSGTEWECEAATAITIGSGVKIESGATVVLIAPTVRLESGFEAEQGSTVKIRQEQSSNIEEPN